MRNWELLIYGIKGIGNNHDEYESGSGIGGEHRGR
jgi:hypothetical protein